MCAVVLAGALAYPEHVRRAVVPVARERIYAGERLFVVQQQGFVAGVEVDCVELRLMLAGETAGFHEAQGGVDARCHLLVALA